MKVEYLHARLTFHVPISITFPEGTLEKIKEQGLTDQKLIAHYRDILKNQANMQLHILPKEVKITRSNIDLLIEQE